jgi:hypothetical protein
MPWSSPCLFACAETLWAAAARFTATPDIADDCRCPVAVAGRETIGVFEVVTGMLLVGSSTWHEKGQRREGGVGLCACGFPHQCNPHYEKE